MLRRNARRFRRRLVLKAHRRVYHSTLAWRVIKKKKVDLAAVVVERHEDVCSGGLLPDAVTLVVAEVHLRLQRESSLVTTYWSESTESSRQF